MNKNKILLIIIVFSAIAAFFIFDLGQYISIDFFIAQQKSIMNYYETYPVNTGIIFFGLYVFLTGLSLPAAGIMTIISGAIFGLFWGTIIVSFASALGASIAFVVSRFLFRDYVQTRFLTNLKTINTGIERDGAFYLFMLRLIPVFPFFIINVVMGLTPLKLTTFYIVSQVGMLLPSMVFVNAGVQIAKIKSIEDILSLELFFAFAL